MEENKKICPNCKNEIDASAAMCPLCGYTEKAKKASAGAGASNELINVAISGVLMLVGLIVTFAFRGWLGTLFSVAGLAYAGFRLYKYSEANGGNIIETLKTGIKSSDSNEKMLTAAVYAGIVVLVIGLIFWFFVDPSRDEKAATEKGYEIGESLFGFIHG